MPLMDLDGRQINYRNTGDGPPVILLHSSSSHSGQWKALMDEAGERFQFIAPDLHGYGRSDPLPENGGPYFLHDVAIVEALIGTTGEPVHIVGHSLGGTVAARIALTHPKDVASLTLIEPVLFNLLEEKMDPRRFEYIELAHAMIILDELAENERAAELFLDYWIGPGALDRLDPDKRDYVISTIDRVAADWRGISQHAPGQIMASEFEKASMPTHLICTAETKPAARAVIELLREMIRHAEYSEISGASHMAPATNPEKVNPVILAFLEAQVVRAERI